MLISLRKNLINVILGLILSLASTIYLVAANSISSPDLQAIRLTQIYGLLAIVFLYISLIISPLYTVFPNLRGKPILLSVRKAFGSGSFGLAILHSSIGFFQLLQGFTGLPFLSNNYQLGISLGAITLFILGLLTLTSAKFLIRKLGLHWKYLHRLVYLASLLIVIHVLILGTHFEFLNNWISIFSLLALVGLLVLEAIRIDLWLAKKYQFSAYFGPISLLLIISLISYNLWFLWRPKDNGTTNNSLSGLNVHTQHLQALQTATTGGANNTANQSSTQATNQPRYSVSFQNPPTSEPNQSLPLKFTITNADTGEIIQNLQLNLDKIAHLVIVSDDLSFFAHIHPEFQQQTLTTNFIFPKENNYHLYLDFTTNNFEQSFAFKLVIGHPTSPSTFNLAKSNLQNQKTFGDLTINLDYYNTTKDTDIQYVNYNFSLKDEQNQPVTYLEPYLGAYGHLVMINTQTYEYLHIHPLQTAVSGNKGGPNLTFIAQNLNNAPIKKGVYRLFLQINPHSQLTIGGFTVEIK